MTSTFITRRIIVETGTTISLSRSMPWMSVPKRSSTPMTRKGTLPISDLAADRILARRRAARATVSPMRATRAAARDRRASK